MTIVKAQSCGGQLAAGRALLQMVEEWAADQGCRSVTLNVFATNERTKAEYKHVGDQPDRYVKVLEPRLG